MASSNHDADPRKLPVVWKPRAERDLDHHTYEWTSGARGGGSVPKDFGWPTNPKAQQEEHGSGAASKPLK